MCDVYFIPFGQTRWRLKSRMDEKCRKVKNKDNYNSSIDSHFWSYNHYYDFSKACIASSSISFSHLNFHEAFDTLKISNNIVNDFSSVSTIPEVWKLFNLLLQNFIYLFIYYLIYWYFTVFIASLFLFISSFIFIM